MNRTSSNSKVQDAQLVLLGDELCRSSQNKLFDIQKFCPQCNTTIGHSVQHVFLFALFLAAKGHSPYLNPQIASNGPSFCHVSAQTKIFFHLLQQSRKMHIIHISRSQGLISRFGKESGPKQDCCASLWGFWLLMTIGK